MNNVNCNEMSMLLLEVNSVNVRHIIIFELIQRRVPAKSMIDVKIQQMTKFKLYGLLENNLNCLGFWKIIETVCAF